jgi:hypothetical protein
MTSAFCLLLISTLMVGCDLSNPTSPNVPADLTGQTTNQQFTFTGTIGFLTISGTLVADDSSTVTITVEVKDAAGNPIQNLTSVAFNANLGGFITGVDSAGANIVVSSATASTFNGRASIDFQSLGRSTGTATIIASLGAVSSSTTVELEPAPVAGNISAAFGVSGTGSTSMTGTASTSVPLDVDISAIANDLTATADPIAGATMRFRIETDTTDETTTNDPVAFVGGVDTVTTNTSGIGAAKIRVQGPGDVVIFVDLIDPSTELTVATSNPIILVTAGGSTVPTLGLLFDNDSTVADLSGTGAPVSIGLIATAKDAAGAALGGVTVRFRIVSDTTGGATLGAGGATTLTATTSGGGTATITTTLTTATQSVVIVAELLDGSGNVINPPGTSNSVIANYD